MHIPDGFLDGKTLALTAGLAVAGLTVAARQVNRTLPRNKIPLMGLGAAFVFAAQMVNFPVAGGTSGHLVGGVLAAVLLGPGAAAIVIACVLTVQAFLFSDGGVLALGANIFNMALVATVTGYAIYKSVRLFSASLRGCLAAVFFAAWGSTVLAAAACAGELAWSGTLPAGVVFPAMLGVHALIGVGEGLITSLVILAIARTRPDLLQTATAPATRGWTWELPVLGLVIAAGVAIFVAPFACSWPDGLDRIAEKFGFQGRAALLVKTWIPDYKMPGISSAGIATALAGAIGTLAMFALAWGVGCLLVRDKPRKMPAASKTDASAAKNLSPP
jgi:cobalt/nickel transport system permease protein